MSLLADRFRKLVAKEKENAMKIEKEADVGYATGILPFDFRNGTIVRVKNDALGLDYKYYSVGVTDGSMNTFIGRSGCGKSTLVTQAAANIVRPFKTACVFEDLTESGMNDSRKEVLTGFYGEELRSRFVTRNTGITTENFYKRIKMLHDLRLAEKEDYMYDTGLRDYNGNPIFKMEPCVYILDSIALLRPGKLTEEEEMSGQMSVTGAAKANSELVRRIIPMLKEANIILFTINHILQAVNIGFKPVASQVMYLSQDERCPGGTSWLYLCNTLVKLHDSKLDPKTFGIDGSIITCKILKSRTNMAGKSIELVYNQARGFDSDLSVFILLKEVGRIVANGGYMAFANHPEVKFRQKEFKDKLQTDENFRKVFMIEALSALQEMCEQDAIQESIGQTYNNASAELLRSLNREAANISA